MAFSFSLQAVFHFRQSVEHQEEIRLRAANQRVGRLRHLLEQVDQCLHQAKLLTSGELTLGTTGSELHLAQMREEVLRAQRISMQRELARLETLRDQQQQVFHQARQQREMIQSLREHQFREYARRENRQQQRRLDDLFLLRQLHLRDEK